MQIGNLQAETFDGQRGPGRWWYVVAGAVVVAAGVGAAAFMIQRAMSGIVPGQRIVVPGEGRLTLTRPGGYTVFHEYRSVVDGKVYSNPGGLAGLECTLTEARTGRAVTLSPVTGQVTYSGGSRAGVGVFEFEITEPGEYVLTGTVTGPGPHGPAVLAVSREFLRELLVLILGGGGILLGGWALAITIFLVTFLKRRKARLARLASDIPPGGPAA